MRYTSGFAASALILAAPISGHASATPEAEQIEGAAIIVTGTREGYRAIDTTSGTKTRTPIRDVPQTIDVVTEAQLRDQAIRSVSDLVRVLPGISAGQGEGHRDQITLRGNNSTADFFVDGLRDDVQYFRSFYNIDRVEVHKGPNAMVFGRGGGGGIVNRITKGALIGDNAANVTGSVDSFGSWYGAVDTNLALNGNVALRFNGFYEALANHRDVYDGDRWALNPTVGARIGEDVRLQLGYEYVRDDRVVDRGIPALGTAPLPGFRDEFFGVPGVNESAFEAHMVRFRAEADLAPGLTFSSQALYGDYDKVYSNAFPATGVTTATSGPLAGQQVLGVEAYRDPTQRQTTIGQANLEWRGDTGGIGHVVLFGAEFTIQRTDNERINGFFAASPLNSSANRRTTIALARPPVLPVPGFVAGPAGAGNRAVASDLDQWSVYLQDQISLSRHFEIVAGLRYDRLRIAVGNRFTGATVARVDDLWSPRVGLVAKPVEGASLYASWAKSYLPQTGDQFLSFDATNATLEPEAFDNYEIGAKWDIRPGLTFTGAVYRLDRTNTRAPVSAGVVALTGAQRTDGFELSLAGQITPQWQTAMAFARTTAKITDTTAAAPAGRRVAQVPQNQLSLWNRYDVSDRIGIGLGLFHQSSQFASINNATRLPGWTRLDAALFVKLTDRLNAQVNIENLTNTTYFPNAHNDNNISTGAPRNARLTITASF